MGATDTSPGAEAAVSSLPMHRTGDGSRRKARKAQGAAGNGSDRPRIVLWVATAACSWLLWWALTLRGTKSDRELSAPRRQPGARALAAASRTGSASIAALARRARRRLRGAAASRRRAGADVPVTHASWPRHMRAGGPILAGVTVLGILAVLTIPGLPWLHASRPSSIPAAPETGSSPITTTPSGAKPPSTTTVASTAPPAPTTTSPPVTAPSVPPTTTSTRSTTWPPPSDFEALIQRLYLDYIDQLVRTYRLDDVNCEWLRSLVATLGVTDQLRPEWFDLDGTPCVAS